MSLELRDIISGIALFVSVYSLAVAARTRKDNLQQSFEQKRQELLLLSAQRKLDLQGVLRKVDNLYRDCRLRLRGDEGTEHALTTAVASMASKLYRSSIAEDSDSVEMTFRNRSYVTHQDLFELERHIGKAKQSLHASRQTIQEAEELLERSGTEFSALAPPET